MKAIPQMFFAALTVIVTAACSKDKAAAPPAVSKDSTAEFLKTGNWKFAVFNISPAFNGVTDGLSVQPPCLRDNLWQYADNSVFYIDEGATKCNEADPQTQQGTWKYDEASKVLTFQTATIDFLLNVTKSSATAISGYRNVTINGSAYVYNGTIVRQ